MILKNVATFHTDLLEEAIYLRHSCIY